MNNKTRKSILVDFITGEPIYIPIIHGNKIITNPITGQKIRFGEWKKRNLESNQNLVKVLKSGDV